MTAHTPQYQRSDRVVYRTIGGERFLVPITGTSADLTRLYLLNETAGAVWNLLATRQTVTSLCARLALEYQEPPAGLHADVQELLAELQVRNLVTSEVPHA